MGACSPALSAAALQAHLAARLQLAAPAPRGGSLAQRMGLVPAPPPPLSPAGWLEVQAQSRLRRDSAGECAICLRAFRADSQVGGIEEPALCCCACAHALPPNTSQAAPTNPPLPPPPLPCHAQVLLSCSHTFHAQCLASFERYARQARCCPLCRCEAYEKRRIDDAARLWRHACATRIQAAWRGHAARAVARQLRRLLPPRDPQLRRRWCVERVQESAAAATAAVEQGCSEVDALFAELDASQAACSAVHRAMAERRAGAGVQVSGRGERSSSGGSAGSTAVPNQAAAPQQQEPEQPAAPDWGAVLHRCLQRDPHPECPICLAGLGISDSRGGGPGAAGPCAAGGSGGGGVCVLSCSHAFHADCLLALEAFAVAAGLGRATCPCCRAAYQRLDLR